MTFRHVPKLSGNGCEDKEQRRGSPDAARDSGNGVRSSRSGLEKRCTQSLKRESSFWSSAARRKEADRVGFENRIQKRKKGDEEWLRAPYAEREREQEKEKERSTGNNQIQLDG
jgi:hypothetical protein